MSENYVPQEETTDEEHAHAADHAVPEDAVQDKQIHEETSPGQEPGDERPEEG